MAGHSKWANIRFRKAAQDARKGKIFTRHIREITQAARQGGGDVNANAKLRGAIEKALAVNMTRDSIDRAIKRGSGEVDGASYEDILYEGHALGGISILVACNTDNRNRTVSEVRHAFSSNGGSLGNAGSAAYLFDKLGVYQLEAGVDENQVFELALNAGADDVFRDDNDCLTVLCAPAKFSLLGKALATAELPVSYAEITYKAHSEVALSTDDSERLICLLEDLEALDDVEEVHSNAMIATDQTAD